MLEHMKEHIDIFICPACRGDLGINHDRLSCKTCGARYQVEDDIPLLFQSSELDNSRKDVTDIVKEFYEKSPFPDYENFESIGDLVQKAQDTFFAKLLNQQIPFNIKVLEVGCGTGQMSNFLGISKIYFWY